jgi:P-type E1-E2 ATPase
LILIALILILSFLTHLSDRKYKHSSKSQVDKITVVRDAKEVEINYHELVKGDVVKLSEGQQVPADIRIFKSNDLTIDNSNITGEAYSTKIVTSPCEKSLTDTISANNFVFYTSNCIRGDGLGVVVKIPNNTLVG